MNWGCRDSTMSEIIDNNILAHNKRMDNCWSRFLRAEDRGMLFTKVAFEAKTIMGP